MRHLRAHIQSTSIYSQRFRAIIKVQQNLVYCCILFDTPIPMVNQNKVTNASSDRDLILIWLGSKSDTTQVSYNSTVTKFIEFVAKPLSEVKLEDLQLWQRGLKARFKPTTVANKVLVIKSLFSFAVKTGYLSFTGSNGFCGLGKTKAIAFSRKNLCDLVKC